MVIKSFCWIHLMESQISLMTAVFHLKSEQEHSKIEWGGVEWPGMVKRIRYVAQ